MKQKNKTHFLSLIVPVWKKEKTIVNNLRKIKSVLESIRYDYEIIVIIDGMLDKSYQNVKKARLRKVMCIAYKENQGKSFAIRLGMSKSKGDYVVFLDSGMEIDPNGISMLLEHMEWYNADIIVGSKRHPASFVRYAFTRKILSYGYYFLVKILFGIKIHDTQAGIKIFRKKVIERTLPRLLEKKFAGDLEILVAASQMGYRRIFEAPIKLDYRLGQITSAATMEAIFNIFTDTMAIWYRKNVLGWYRRPHKRLTHLKNLQIVIAYPNKVKS